MCRFSGVSYEVAAEAMQLFLESNWSSSTGFAEMCLAVKVKVGRNDGRTMKSNDLFFLPANGVKKMLV